MAKNSARGLKKPVAVEAEQWFAVTYDREAGHGIEPEDMPIYHLGVGYYRTPELDGQDKCKNCADIMRMRAIHYKRNNTDFFRRCSNKT